MQEITVAKSISGDKFATRYTVNAQVTAHAQTHFCHVWYTRHSTDSEFAWTLSYSQEHDIV